MKRLVFCVTNDLNYDQRMQRSCTALQEAGYDVLLVGRRRKQSPPLSSQPFRQRRLNCWFETGKLFYLEFNIRLFLYLLFVRCDALVAIDLDTILPVYLVSRWRNKIRIYDAHELFCEMKEVVERPAVYRAWKRLEQWLLPRFPLGYTVNQPIADWFKQAYRVDYAVIRNVPKPYPYELREREPFILYQGAVNEGRCFETIIPAMKSIPLPLIICGDGNFMDQAKALVQEHQLEKKVFFKGMLAPQALKEYTLKATVGLNIIDSKGLNNYWSLANRFFDYIQAGLPQVTVNYPAYRQLLEAYPVGLGITDPAAAEISTAVNKLLNDKALYTSAEQACKIAREELNWEKEAQILVNYYQTKVFCRN